MRRYVGAGNIGISLLFPYVYGIKRKRERERLCMWPFSLAGRSKDTVLHVTYARSLCVARPTHILAFRIFLYLTYATILSLFFSSHPRWLKKLRKKYALPLTYFCPKSSSKNASKSLSIPKSGTTSTTPYSMSLPPLLAPSQR